jgi:hypothetical protein
MVLINAGVLKEDKDEIENVQITNDYFNKQKLLEFLLCFYAFVGILCAVVEYEMRYDQTRDGKVLSK